MAERVLAAVIDGGVAFTDSDGLKHNISICCHHGV